MPRILLTLFSHRNRNMLSELLNPPPTNIIVIKLIVWLSLKIKILLNFSGCTGVPRGGETCAGVRGDAGFGGSKCRSVRRIIALRRNTIYYDILRLVVRLCLDVNDFAF